MERSRIDAQKFYQTETDKILGDDTLENAFSEGTEQNLQHRDGMFRVLILSKSMRLTLV